MEKLVKAAMNGDKEAFAQIIECLKIDLYKIAKVRLKDEEDIFDAIQDTIVSSYKSIKKLSNPEKFKKWIIKILINKCNNIYLQRKEKSIPFDEVSENLIQNENNYNNLEMEEVLKYLTEEEKMIITLYYLEDYKSKEISWILDMNENTVKTKISRAKLKLKQKLEGGNFYNG